MVEAPAIAMAVCNDRLRDTLLVADFLGISQ